MKRLLASVALLLLAGNVSAQFRGYGRCETTNFSVTAATQEEADLVGQWAETWRKFWAERWLGHEVPAWGRRCPIRVGKLRGGQGPDGAVYSRNSGVTSFNSGGIQMSIESSDRPGLLWSVLPHEVTHTLLVPRLEGRAPRWCDEGCCMLVEAAKEQERREVTSWKILDRGGFIPTGRLLVMHEYPSGHQAMSDFYNQSYSLSRYLCDLKGRREFLACIEDGVSKGWNQSLSSHYGIAGVQQLDASWHGWIATRRQLVAQNNAAPVPQAAATGYTTVVTAPSSGATVTEGVRAEGQPTIEPLSYVAQPPSQPRAEVPQPRRPIQQPQGWDQPLGRSQGAIWCPPGGS